MKKLFAITLCLSVFALFAFQKHEKATSAAPAEKGGNITVNLSDTSDLDDQMKKLEAEMKQWEQKMKPYEAEMKQFEQKMKPYQEQMRQWEQKMKPYEKKMRELESKMKKAKTDEEREAVGKEMGDIGDKMSKVGEDMSGIGTQMGDVGEEMGKIGEKMGKIGEEMGKVGEKMGVVGEAMHKRHKKIFSWFFQELKNDGLLKDHKCSIMMEEGVFIVNGQTLNAEQLQKYKKGIEQRLGKPLKSDFSFYFKGTIENMTEENFEFDGNMNSHY